MKKITVNKLQFFIFILSILATSSVYADIFYSDSDCMGCGVSYYHHRIHHHRIHHHAVAHHRCHHYHVKRIYVSACCAHTVWIKNNCDACAGAWMPVYPSMWQTINYGYVRERPGYHYYYGDEYYWTYDPDLATGDDDQYRHPDMDIDY